MELVVFPLALVRTAITPLRHNKTAKQRSNRRCKSKIKGHEQRRFRCSKTQRNKGVARTHLMCMCALSMQLLDPWHGVGWLVGCWCCLHDLPFSALATNFLCFTALSLSLSVSLSVSLPLSTSRPLCLSTSLSTSLSPDWRYTNAMVVKIEVIGLRHDALFHTARHAAQVRRQTDACLIGCDAAPCSSSSLLLLLPAGFAGCSTYKQSASETLMSPAQT